MAYTIEPATRADLPALAEVNRSSYSEELASRFAHNSWTDTSYMYTFFKGRIGVRFDEPETQMFKAVDPGTGEIVGFACWTLEKGTVESKETPTGTMISRLPAGMNKEFIVAAGQQIEELRDLMKVEEHYCKLVQTCPVHAS